MSEAEQRQAVIAEALAWEGTPFHHRACVKGAGVDCARLLEAAFKAAGLVPSDFQPPPYPFQWHLHQTRELYLEIIASMGGRLVEAADPGDVAIWRMGKTFSHAAIVIAWPEIIHASVLLGRVRRDHAVESPMHLVNYPVRFYSAWK